MYSIFLIAYPVCPEIMNTIRYNLSHANRLFSHLQINRGVLPVVQTHLSYIRNIRRGSRISRLFRHIFERNIIKSILGTNVALFVLASSFLPVGASNILDYDHAEEQIISQQIIELKTEKSIQIPTEKLILNQGYSWYHRAVDIEGVTGDLIKPIMPGVVSEVQYSNFGYGNAVIIKHGDDLSSLYAHMSKVFVKPDEPVTLNSVIGEVGSTGHSTGDHLHLEVRSGDTQVNPLTVIQ